MNSRVPANVPVPNPEIFSDPNPNYKFLSKLAQREQPEVGDRYLGEHMNDDISQDINMMDNYVHNEHSYMINNAERLLDDSTPLNSIYDIPENKKEMDDNMYNYTIGNHGDIDQSEDEPYDRKIITRSKKNKSVKQSNLYNNILFVIVIVIVCMLLYRKYK